MLDADVSTLLEETEMLKIFEKNIKIKLKLSHEDLKTLEANVHNAEGTIHAKTVESMGTTDSLNRLYGHLNTVIEKIKDTKNKIEEEKAHKAQAEKDLSENVHKKLENLTDDIFESVRGVAHVNTGTSPDR